MINYYIERNNKISIFDTDLERLQFTIKNNPDYEGLEIKETERSIINFEFTDTPEYQEKLKQQYLQEFAELKDYNLYIDVYNLKLLRLGYITQEIYDARIQQNDNDFETIFDDFYTKTGLVKPTIIE